MDTLEVIDLYLRAPVLYSKASFVPLFFIKILTLPVDTLQIKWRRA